MASIKECAAPFCTSVKGKTKGISYHEFPSDEKIRSLWTGNISRQASKSNKTPWTPFGRLVVISLSVGMFNVFVTYSYSGIVNFQLQYLNYKLLGLYFQTEAV
jgi:hypothetical protein